MTTTPRHRDQKVSAKRAILALLAVVTVALVVAGSVTSFSSASFTSRTVSAASTVQAATDWTPPTVTMQSPGATVRGSVTLTATASDADSGIRDVGIQQRPASGGAWVTACTLGSAPFTCTLNSTATPSGAYELRAVATDRADNSATSDVVRTIVDNTAPAVTMTDPGATLSGTRTFAATASDAHSGVAQVVIQAQANGSSTWTTICTDTSSPYSCSYDTRSLNDGTYSFRAVATDVAGNSTTSTVVANRVVSNVVSTATVSVVDPGANLAGIVVLRANGTASAGIASIRLQYTPNGGATWTDACTATTSPYTCSWNTTGLTNGLYDVRALLTDTDGRTTTSAVVSARRIDNTVLAGADVQTVNGGQAGRPDEGDRVVYTFNKVINLNSVLNGWDGSARGVTSELVANNATFEVLGAELGLINLNTRFNGSGSAVRFASTMTASTISVNGVPRTVVTVELDSRTQGGQLNGGTNATMVWTPSGRVADMGGRASATTAVNESGPQDTDF